MGTRKDEGGVIAYSGLYTAANMRDMAMWVRGCTYERGMSVCSQQMDGMVEVAPAKQGM